MSFRPPSPGAIVDGKYRLLRRIGGGGMADVYRAARLAHDDVVAIKLLHPELADDRDVAQRFFHEAKTVSRVVHPNIVPMLDFGVSEHGPYMVMEHLDGESIGTALVRLGRFEQDAAVAAMLPLLDALSAAHDAGVVHRDLKPENVFVARHAPSGEPVVKLLDFGIAKVLDAAETPRTRTGIVFGTPDYLSPEQATGEAPLDGRSDLFAVGVILLEVLTGERPFRAPTAVATAFRIVHTPPTSPASLGVTLHPNLERLVQRLLEKDPARRFQSAREAAAALERVVPDPARRTAALARMLDLDAGARTS